MSLGKTGPSWSTNWGAIWQAVFGIKNCFVSNSFSWNLLCSGDVKMFKHVLSHGDALPVITARKVRGLCSYRASRVGNCADYVTSGHLIKKIVAIWRIWSLWHVSRGKHESAFSFKATFSPSRRGSHQFAPPWLVTIYALFGVGSETSKNWSRYCPCPPKKEKKMFDENFT